MERGCVARPTDLEIGRRTDLGVGDDQAVHASAQKDSAARESRLPAVDDQLVLDAQRRPTRRGRGEGVGAVAQHDDRAGPRRAERLRRSTVPGSKQVIGGRCWIDRRSRGRPAPVRGVEVAASETLRKRVEDGRRAPRTPVRSSTPRAGRLLVRAVARRLILPSEPARPAHAR